MRLLLTFQFLHEIIIKSENMSKMRKHRTKIKTVHAVKRKNSENKDTINGACVYGPNWHREETKTVVVNEGKRKRAIIRERKKRATKSERVTETL